MTNCEKLVLNEILRDLQPEVSLEIGTYMGGSLQVVSHYSHSVFSLDIDSTVKERLKGKFQNVEYRCGESRQLFPRVLKEIKARNLDLEFVLIDGDHSTQGVLQDIEALMEFVPRKRCLILIHDSFNPECRQGIVTAQWSTSPYVESVELDFCPGIYHQEVYDTAKPRTMWGGFALAVLTPEKRVRKLKIQASQQSLFDAVFKVSSHANYASLRTRLSGAIGRIKAFYP